MHSIDEEIYEAGEDTYLLIDVLSENVEWIKNKVVVEIGVGNRVVFNYLCRHAKLVVGSDINRGALRGGNNGRCFLVLGDGASFLNYAEVVVFNPPYLPTLDPKGKVEYVALEGGRKGIEATLKFILHALSLRGVERVIFVTSSFSSLDELEKELEELNLKFWREKELRLEDETLYIYVVQKELK